MKRTLIITIFTLCSFLVFAQKQEVRLLFVGDAMQHKSQIEAAKTEDGSYDYSSYFEKVKDNIRAADISVVNLEVTLAGPPHTGYPAFSAPDHYAQELKDAGFNVFVTANNHSADRRSKGIERTIHVLDSLDITHTGTFKDSLEREIFYPLMIIENGIRIAMLNYTYGTNGIPVAKPNIVNPIDTILIKKDIAEAKLLGADLIVANMHWGDEYKLKQNNIQTRLANFLVRNGVRLVVGNHPHVVQPVDIRREGDSIKSIVIYSLGNFISGMRTVDTSGGMLVNINISKETGQPITFDSFDYSLLWTYKPKQDGVYSSFQLLPVVDYENERGKKKLTVKEYTEMTTFAKNARKAIESLW